MKRFFYLTSSLLALVIMIGSLPSVARATDDSAVVTLCMMSPNGFFPGQLIERDLGDAHALANYLNGLTSEETSWLLDFFASLFGMEAPDINPEFQICTQFDFEPPNGCTCTESLPEPETDDEGLLQYCFVRQGASTLGTIVTQPAGRARAAMDLFNSMDLEDTSAFTAFFGFLLGAQPAPSLEFVPRACEAFTDVGGGQCSCDDHNTSGPFIPSDDSSSGDDEINSGEGVQTRPGQENNSDDGHGSTRRGH